MDKMQERSAELDFNSIRTVDLYPYEEVVKIMEALKEAEQKRFDGFEMVR
jgi:biopolymer transport protein ExbD